MVAIILLFLARKGKPVLLLGKLHKNAGITFR